MGVKLSPLVTEWGKGFQSGLFPKTAKRRLYQKTWRRAYFLFLASKAAPIATPRQRPTPTPAPGFPRAEPIAGPKTNPRAIPTPRYLPLGLSFFSGSMNQSLRSFITRIYHYLRRLFAAPAPGPLSVRSRNRVTPARKHSPFLRPYRVLGAFLRVYVTSSYIACFGAQGLTTARARGSANPGDFQ